MLSEFNILIHYINYCDSYFIVNSIMKELIHFGTNKE